MRCIPREAPHSCGRAEGSWDSAPRTGLLEASERRKGNGEPGSETPLFMEARRQPRGDPSSSSSIGSSLFYRPFVDSRLLWWRGRRWSLLLPHAMQCRASSSAHGRPLDCCHHLRLSLSLWTASKEVNRKPAPKKERDGGPGLGQKRFHASCCMRTYSVAAHSIRWTHGSWLSSTYVLRRRICVSPP